VRVFHFRRTPNLLVQFAQAQTTIMSSILPTCNAVKNGFLMYSSVSFGANSPLFSQCSMDTIAATTTAQGACFMTAAQLATTATTCSADDATTVSVTTSACLLMIDPFQYTLH
jgi:hypothetical protein